MSTTKPRQAAVGPQDPVNEVGSLTSENGLTRDPFSCTGSAATKVLASRSKRSLRHGVEIHNADTLYDLWVVPVNVDETAPVITQANKNYSIPPEGTYAIAYGEWVDIYVQNSSGGATVSYGTATEVRR